MDKLCKDFGTCDEGNPDNWEEITKMLCTGYVEKYVVAWRRAEAFAQLVALVNNINEMRERGK